MNSFRFAKPDCLQGPRTWDFCFCFCLHAWFFEDWLTEELFPSSRQTPLPPRIPVRTTRPLTRLPLGIPSSGDEYFARITNNQERRIVTPSVPLSPSSIFPPSSSASVYSSRILAELGGNQGQDEIDNEIDEEDIRPSVELDECAKTGLFCRGGTVCVNLTCQCPPSYILHNDRCIPPITPKKQINKRKGKSSYRGTNCFVLCFALLLIPNLNSFLKPRSSFSITFQIVLIIKSTLFQVHDMLIQRNPARTVKSVLAVPSAEENR